MAVRTMVAEDLVDLRTLPAAAGGRAVLLDLYDTLLTFDWSVLRATNVEIAVRLGIDAEVLERAERELMPKRMLGVFGTTLEDELAAVLRAAGAPDDTSSVRLYRDRQLEAWRAATRIPDEATHVIWALREAGLKLALVSNCSRLTRALLPCWRFSTSFDAIVLSCEVGAVKPGRAIYDRALADLGCTAAEALLVDDDAENVVAARELGMEALTVTPAVDRVRRDALEDLEAESDEVVEVWVERVCGVDRAISCRLRLYPGADSARPVVIAEDVPPRHDVDEHVESIWRGVARWLESNSFVLVEHHDVGRWSQAHSYSVVTVDCRGFPRWRFVSAAEVRRLIADPQADRGPGSGGR